MKFQMKLQMMVCFTVLGLATNAHASAKFAAVQGDVRVTPLGGSERAATVGAAVEGGSEIKAGKNGSAELKFDNGSILKIRANTAMRLSGNKRQKKKSSVVLFFGRVWSKVVGNKDRGYEVATPNAVCGVRGTEFETAVGDDGTVRVRVTKGNVAVNDGTKESSVDAGQEVEADVDGVDDTMTAEEKAKWEMWERRKADNLRKNGRKLVDKVKGKIMSKKARLEKLRDEQKGLESKRKRYEDRARTGDQAALNEVRKINMKLAEIADEIADIGDITDSQFGLVDHYADLADDPRFRMIDRKYLIAEAASLRRIKAMLDKMVKDGTDISAEAMNDMMDDMGSGKGGGLLDKGGSSADELFGGDDMFK